MAYIIRGNEVGSGINVNSPNHLAVTVDLSAAAWKSVASHEVFNVTGLVRMQMWIECTENVASDGATTIQFGVEGATNAIIASTTATDIAANDLWYDATPAVVYDVATDVIMDYIINGLDVGYELGVAVTTNGTLVVHTVWEPLAVGASVVAGTGVAL